MKTIIIQLLKTTGIALCMFPLGYMFAFACLAS